MNIPGYYQVPLETTHLIDLFGRASSDVSIEINVNDVVVHQVDMDEIINDITIGNHDAIININPDPTNPNVLGNMFIQISDVDTRGFYDAVKIVVRV